MSPQNDFQNYRPITGCERSFFVFNGDFNGEMAKNGQNGHLAIRPWANNSGKWGIPEKSYKNVAQQ